MQMYPSTIVIKDLNNTSLFNFSNVSVADIKKDIRKLDPRKATQNTDIPGRILKQSSDIFRNYICNFFKCVDKGVFPSILKNANITPVFKKVLEDQKTITDRLVYFQLSLKYLRNYYQNK